MSSDWPPDGAGQAYRIWTLRKGDEVAVCEAVRLPTGLELAVLTGNDQTRTQAFRVPTDATDKANEWRGLFLAHGWTDAPETSTEH